jgi:hypothetical protein
VRHTSQNEFVQHPPLPAAAVHQSRKNSLNTTHQLAPLKVIGTQAMDLAEASIRFLNPMMYNLSGGEHVINTTFGFNQKRETASHLAINPGAEVPEERQLERVRRFTNTCGPEDSS